MNQNYLKLYIAVLDEVPNYMTPTLVAHSMLGAHLEFGNSPIDIFHGRSSSQYNEWLKKSFRKCVVKVNRKEFEKIKQLGNVYLGHENTILNGEKSCVIPYPVWSNDLPNVLKFAKLWASGSLKVKVLIGLMPLIGEPIEYEENIEIKSLDSFYIRHNCYDNSFDIVDIETQFILKTIEYKEKDIKSFFYSFELI